MSKLQKRKTQKKREDKRAARNLRSKQKKIQKMEQSIVNLTLANKSRPAKTQQPKLDPNKVYSVKIGNSFVQGNKNAKVTIIEWADYF